MYNAVKNNNLAGFKCVEELKDIVSVQKADTGYKDGPGWITTVAFNSDGKYYDLLNILDDVTRSNEEY